MPADRVVDIKSMIRTIPDYPSPGILFRDITTLIADPVGLRATIDGLVWPFLTSRIDHVVGIEARGFILGGAVAHELGRGFGAFWHEHDSVKVLPAGSRGPLPSDERSEEPGLIVALGDIHRFLPDRAPNRVSVQIVVRLAAVDSA